MAQVESLFAPGQILLTPGVIENVPRVEILGALIRHVEGDWGDCCDADIKANEEAVKNGGRIISVYMDEGAGRFWVITEAVDESGKRPFTTVLLPSEY